MPIHKGEHLRAETVNAIERGVQAAGQFRVVGGRGSGGAGGANLHIPAVATEQCGTVLQGYQGNWPTSAGALISAFQFVAVEFPPYNADPDILRQSQPLVRYRRTNWTGSGNTLGITLRSATDKWDLLPIKIKGIAPLLIMTTTFPAGLPMVSGDRVGCATGVGDGYYDRQGPATLLKELIPEPPQTLPAGKALWLVMLHAERGDTVGFTHDFTYPAAGSASRVPKTVLFATAKFSLTETDPMVIKVIPV